MQLVRPVDQVLQNLRTLRAFGEWFAAGSLNQVIANSAAVAIALIQFRLVANVCDYFPEELAKKR